MENPQPPNHSPNMWRLDIRLEWVETAFYYLQAWSQVGVLLLGLLGLEERGPKFLEPQQNLEVHWGIHQERVGWKMVCSKSVHIMPSIPFTELANAEYNLFIELVYGDYTANWVTTIIESILYTELNEVYWVSIWRYTELVLWRVYWVCIWRVYWVCIWKVYCTLSQYMESILYTELVYMQSVLYTESVYESAYSLHTSVICQYSTADLAHFLVFISPWVDWLALCFIHSRHTHLHTDTHVHNQGYSTGVVFKLTSDWFT